MQKKVEPHTTHSIRWRNYLFLIGILFVGFLIWYFGWRSLWTSLRTARPFPLLIMILLLLAGFWIRAWKWRYALKEKQHAIGLFFLSKMAGNWSPGRIGELSPLLLRRHRTPQLAAWIAADRIIEVAMTLLLGLFGVFMLHLLSPLLISLLSIATLLGTALLLWCIAKIDLFTYALHRWPHNTLLTRILRLAQQVHQETRLLGSKLPLILTLTFLGKLTDILAVIWLCKSFGYETSFALVCAARCAHALISAIPITPDATGVPFIAAAYLLHEHAHIPYETLTTALGLEVILINIVLWICFIFGAWRLRHS